MTKTLYVFQGVPGSGKSTLAKAIAGDWHPILSTDDFFMVETEYAHEYRFDPKKLPEAHKWNQDRCRSAMAANQRVIVIDNTNTQAWEAKPYVQMGIDHGYNIAFVSPGTPWSHDAAECAKRNTHGVPEEAIRRMLARMETLTVEKCLNAKAPWEKDKAKS